MTTLYEAVKAVNNVCDGARIQDNVGFNAPDSAFFKYIMRLPFDNWKPEEKHEAYIRIRKYVGQLSNFGIDIKEIPIPEKPKQEYTKRDINVVNYIDNEFKVSFNYNPVLVDLIKSLPYINRKWDGINKIWSITYNDLTIKFIKKLINEYGFIFIGESSILNEEENTSNSSNPVSVVNVITKKITITQLKNGKLWFTFNYDPKFVEICKNLKGKFIKTDARVGWEITVTIDNIDKIGDILSKDYVIADLELSSKLIEEKEKFISLYSMSYKDKTDIKIEGINDNIYPFQKAGVDYVLKAKKTFISDSMGLGKSVQALSAFVASGSKKALVICPKSMKHVWKNEVEKWYPNKTAEILNKGFDPKNTADICIINYDGIISRKKIFKTFEEAFEFFETTISEVLNVIDDIVTRGKINKLAYESTVIKQKYDNNKVEKNTSKKNIEKLIRNLNQYSDVYYDISKDVENIDYDFIIIDESHYLKNGKAERTKQAINLAKKCEYRLLLTGTPTINRPCELISQLSFLDRLDDFGGWYDFVNKYCEAKKVSYRTGSFWDVSGASNLEDLNKNLRRICFIRRTKEEVLKELPDKIVTHIPVEVTNKKEYSIAENEFYEWYKENKATVDKNINISEYEQLMKLTYLRQLTALGKIETIVEWVKDFFEEDNNKLVIFAHHREVIDKLMNELKEFNPVTINGSISDKGRKESIDKFLNNKDNKIIIGNLAMAEGLTLTNTSHMIFAEYFWTYAQHNQAEDRIHRIGQKYPCNYYYFDGIGTIDEDMKEMVDKKKNITEIIANGFIKKG